MSGKHFAGRIFASLAVAAAMAWPVAAADGWNSSYRGSDYQYHYRSGPFIGSTTPVSRLRGVGSFSRSVWVIDRDRLKAPILAPKATILHVSSSFRLGALSNACSYEAGVCVIRAGN